MDSEHEAGSVEGASGDVEEMSVPAGDIVAPLPPPPSKKLRAKRLLLRQMSKEGGTAAAAAAAAGIPTGPRTWKNTRRPRNGFGLGHAKKGGAGGKFVWGKLGSELEPDVDMDTNDPNYDSDSIDDPTVELKKIIPEEELRTEMEPILQEYLLHGDTEEAEVSLRDLTLGSKRSLVVVVAIEIALDHKPSHREMTSVLISDLYGRLLSTKDVVTGFETLFRNLSDLSLDTPDAAIVLGNFLARAIADDCIPPKVITTLRQLIDTPEAKTGLTRADTLLSMRHGLVRLDNVWGVGGGLRPVKYLVKQMNILLKEYLSSSDLQEAERCLKELEVPHFHHELVYEAMIMVIEAINGQVEESMVKLLKYLCDAVIITPDMMERGMLRVFEDMADIVLDVPLAYSVLERFCERCTKAEILTEEITRRIPSRGRKRFVSEGDGGRIKEQHL